MENRNSGLNLRTKQFAVSIFLACREISNDTETRVIKNQLLRSSSSVAANTRASFRSRSNREYVAKVGVVIEEADESGFWIELLLELKLIEKNLGEKLQKEAEELVAIFTSISKKIKSELVKK